MNRLQIKSIVHRFVETEVVGIKYQAYKLGTELWFTKQKKHFNVVFYANDAVADTFNLIANHRKMLNEYFL